MSRLLCRLTESDDTRHVSRCMLSTNSKHPGLRVFEECIAPHGLTVTEAAAGLMVTRNTLSRLIHGHHGISPEMALRLSLAFGGTPEIWLQRQIAYDLANVSETVVARDITRFFAAPKSKPERKLLRRSLLTGDQIHGRQATSTYGCGPRRTTRNVF